MPQVHAVQLQERHWQFRSWFWMLGACCVWFLISHPAEAGERKSAPVRAPKAVQAPMQAASAPPIETGWTHALASERMHAKLAQDDCKALRIDESSLHAAQHILKPMGLALQVLGCPEAPAPFHHHVLAVTAVVIDGDKAMNVVRGALGDGEPVDMGSGYTPVPWPGKGVQPGASALDDADISPDVQFNRRWLRQVMASQGFASLVGPWWAFQPMPKP